MSTINTTLWPIEPHTEAKHEILQKYLNAWLPILTKWHGKVVYIDGFAGPGEYVGGKIGSPIIAINSVINHTIKINSDIMMLFVEAKKDRCKHLESSVMALDIPDNIKVKILCNEFKNVMGELLDHLEAKNGALAPSFVFIDPFGFSGIPMDIIKRIMQNARCEVLITFMYDDMNRFLTIPGNEKHLDETFGSPKWRDTPPVGNSKARLQFLHNLYRDQLRSYAEIEHVHSFKMINKSNKADYFLFFGTNNITGLAKMKAAMWRIDETGSFQFSDATHNPLQGVLFETEPRFDLLKKIILNKFKGLEVRVGELEEFIITETPFLDSHYKTKILRPMEVADPPEIRVKVAGSRRRGTYKDKNILIEFL